MEEKLGAFVSGLGLEVIGVGGWGEGGGFMSRVINGRSLKFFMSLEMRSRRPGPSLLADAGCSRWVGVGGGFARIPLWRPFSHEPGSGAGSPPCRQPTAQRRPWGVWAPSNPTAGVPGGHWAGAGYGHTIQLRFISAAAVTVAGEAEWGDGRECTLPAGMDLQGCGVELMGVLPSSLSPTPWLPPGRGDFTTLAPPTALESLHPLSQCSESLRGGADRKQAPGGLGFFASCGMWVHITQALTPFWAGGWTPMRVLSQGGSCARAVGGAHSGLCAQDFCGLRGFLQLVLPGRGE